MMTIQASMSTNGDSLPIVSPGVSRGKGDLLTAADIFTSQVIQGQTVYIFCESVIHIAEGLSVSDTDAPIDARSGIYLSVNAGKQLSFKLMGASDPATVWIHEVR
jgi:hypothetical protein